MPRCSEIRRLGLQHRVPGARLLAARHAPVYDATDGCLDVPRVGVYKAWLKGSARGAIALYVDGRKVGEVRQHLQNDGGWLDLGTARLDAGLPRPETGPLLFTPAGEEAGRLVSVPIAEASRLCGRPWDWIEAIGSGVEP